MYLEGERQLWRVSLNIFFTSNSRNLKTAYICLHFFTLSTPKHLPLTNPIALPKAASGWQSKNKNV